MNIILSFLTFYKHDNFNPLIWFGTITSNGVNLSLWKIMRHYCSFLKFGIYFKHFIKKELILIWWFILKYKFENYNLSISWFFLKILFYSNKLFYVFPSLFLSSKSILLLVSLNSVCHALLFKGSLYFILTLEKFWILGLYLKIPLNP